MMPVLTAPPCHPVPHVVRASFGYDLGHDNALDALPSSLKNSQMLAPGAMMENATVTLTYVPLLPTLQTALHPTGARCSTCQRYSSLVVSRTTPQPDAALSHPCPCSSLCGRTPLELSRLD